MNDFSSRVLGEMVAVGATDARSVRLWIRTAEPGPHEIEVWSDPARKQRGTVALAPARGGDGTTSILVPDAVADMPPLAAGTRYEVRVCRGDRVLGTGRFTTAPASPADAPERFAIAMMSCHQPFDDGGALHAPSLETLAVLDAAFRARGVERLLLMGDQMYADYPTKLSLFDEKFFVTVAPPGRRTIFDCTRDEVRALYQRRYHAFWSIEPFRSLLASYPSYPVPDDHEIHDNFGSGPEHASAEWEAIHAGALDAFDDYQGQLAHARVSPRRGSFDYALTYGNVGVFGLDVRSRRRNDGERLRICSEEQFAALEGWLRSASALDVVMLVTSVPLAIYPSWVASLGTLLLGKDSDAADRWSHPTATEDRRRLTAILFEHQRRNPHQRVLLLGGDIHIGCAVKFLLRDRSIRPMHQLVSSSVSNLTDALRRKLGMIAPHLDPHLEGDADDLWDRIELLEGPKDASRNPFDGLNAGVVTMQRDPGGGLRVTFELLSHSGETPPTAHTVFTTELE